MMPHSNPSPVPPVEAIPDAAEQGVAERPIAPELALPANQTRAVGTLAVAGESSPVAPSTGTEELARELDLTQRLADQATARVHSARINLLRTGELPAVHRDPEPVEMSSASRMPTSEMIGRFESAHHVKQVPKLDEQLGDPTRMMLFEYLAPRQSLDIPGPEGVMTETDALWQLHDFLHDFITMSEQQGKGGRGKNPTLAEAARSILESVSFIGQPEYAEAAQALGDVWKDYLDGDPERKLCLLAGIGSLERYDGMRKSDDFLRDTILSSFSDEELEKYSGRIVAGVEDMDADPSKGKIVMLDDWSITGKQMRDVYYSLIDNPTFKAYVESGKVEINLLIASEDRIKNGLAVNPYEPTHGHIPVFAYYQSHEAPLAKREQRAHITGLHSTVNFDFSGPLKEMAKKDTGNYAVIPAIARVNPVYHFAPRKVEITNTALRRTDSGEGR